MFCNTNTNTNMSRKCFAITKSIPVMVYAFQKHQPHLEILLRSSTIKIFPPLYNSPQIYCFRFQCSWFRHNRNPRNYGFYSSWTQPRKLLPHRHMVTCQVGVPHCSTDWGDWPFKSGGHRSRGFV